MTDLRDAMRAAIHSDLTPFDMPEWGRTVYIRKLSIKDQLALTEDDPKPEVATLRILIVSLCDEDGTRQLEDSDMDLLLEQPFPVVAPLISKVAAINGITNQEIEAAMSHFGLARDESPPTVSPSLSGAPSQNSRSAPTS